jgi:Fe-S cluster assembly protein SufD
MQSPLVNFIEITSVLNKVIEVKKSSEFIIVDTHDTDSTIDLSFKLKSSIQCHVYLYILNSHHKKRFNIQIDHQSNSKSEVVVKVIGAQHAQTHIDITSVIKPNTIQVTSNETVDGILLDDSAEINVLPAMLINGNKMKAGHSVNIGNINPEQLFYLMSRGNSKSEATKILLNAMFNKIQSYKHKSAILMYNNISKVLAKLLRHTNGN